MSADRFMDLAREISEQLNVVPKTNQFRFKLKILDDKFKSTVKQVGKVYPTAEYGSKELSGLMTSLDHVESSLAEIQSDLNRDTGELNGMVRSSMEVIEALKAAQEHIYRDPDAVLSARAMYTDKKTLYLVGYINMWVKVCVCFILLLIMYRSFGYVVAVFICSVVVYFLVLAFQYLFTKYPQSTALVGQPVVDPPPTNCANSTYGCCPFNPLLEKKDAMGSNCPHPCPKAAASSMPSSTS